MKTYFGGLSLLVLAMTLSPVTVSAEVPTPAAQGDFDGRHYEIIAANNISWTTANAAAGAATYQGVNGHLATITSAAEDLFIESLRLSAELAIPETWVGGLTESESECSPVPGCGWMWNQYGWNDEGNLGLIGGYVIEYDTPTPVDPEECTGEEGCETTNGQAVVLPPSAVGEDAEIGIRTFEFTDDPARCGVSPLVLFNTDSDPDNDLIIPPYLCGSPNFLIVQIRTDNIDITEGVVQVENEVTDALPNNLYECTGPIDPMMLLSMADTLDPQHRDKVTYQRDNPADMLENDIGATIDPVFAGAMTELTDSCGSSRGKVMSFSYYGIGLSINFGAGYDLELNPDANRERFAALTRYKIVVLQAAVREAWMKGSISSLSYRYLSFPLRAAISLHDNERYESALRKIRIFQYLVSNRVTYGVVADENFGGEHDARASNIEFMYTDSVIPFH